VTRLIDIGVEPFLVASSVGGILAQRLVRVICPHCKEEVDPDALNELERRLLGEAEAGGGFPLFQGAGCEHCRFTGYRGRSAIGEVLMVSPAIRRLSQQRASAEEIKRQASQEGMRTMRDAALAAVRAGKTTVSELLRVTQEDF